MLNLFVLASASPRRREILSEAGYVFDVVPSAVEEKFQLDVSPDVLAMRLARLKAEDVAGSLPPEAVVLGADTIVVLGGEILGKPEGEADAKRMLGLLSGQTHEVITGFTVIRHSDSQEISLAVTTLVRFRKLTQEEIASYVATGEPMDKAGAYGIQGLGGKLVESIEGDFNNVVGLPLEEVAQVLKSFELP